MHGLTVCVTTLIAAVIVHIRATGFRLFQVRQVLGQPLLVAFSLPVVQALHHQGRAWDRFVLGLDFFQHLDHPVANAGTCGLGERMAVSRPVLAREPIIAAGDARLTIDARQDEFAQHTSGACVCGRANHAKVHLALELVAALEVEFAHEQTADCLGRAECPLLIAVDENHPATCFVLCPIIECRHLGCVDVEFLHELMRHRQSGFTLGIRRPGVVTQIEHLFDAIQDLFHAGSLFGIVVCHGVSLKWVWCES